MAATISNGIYGAAVLDMNERTTRAKKSWFFFDDEIVCLGTGITDNSGLDVRTTINQAKLVKPSYCSEVGSTSDPSQTSSNIIVTIKNKGLLYKKDISLPSDKGMKGSSVTVE